MAYIFTQNGTTDIASGASSGRMGVGTASAPAKILQVNTPNGGQLRLQSSLSSLDFHQYSSGTARIEANTGSLQIRRNDSSKVLFQNNSGSTHLAVGSDGKTGIGTDTPSKKLDIYGNVLLHTDLQSTQESDGILIIQNTGSSNYRPKLLFRNSNTGSNSACMFSVFSHQKGDTFAINLELSSDNTNKPLWYGRQGLRFGSLSTVGSTPAMSFIAGVNVNATVCIGDSVTVNTSAILEIVSTKKALLITRIAATSGIANPADGMVIYNSTSAKFQCRASGVWRDLH